MDVLRAVNNYTNKMIKGTPGIKILLLDSETTAIVSLAATTSHLLTHEVYLTDRIDNTNRETMPHLKCIAFVRPSPESLAALERELERPRYGSYYLYFTNVLKKSAIERLADADQQEVVQEVQEFFADYCPISCSLFSLNILPSPLSPLVMSMRHRLYSEVPSAFDQSPETGSFQRHIEGLTALLLSLKKKPVIRYEKMSGMAKKLGQEMLYQFSAETGLFDFRPSASPPLLLILDRRNDPVTPLLSQWTYQAMVHELIGINNGRVDLSNVPDIPDDLKEIVLSPEQDPFFARTLYDNFGDLGAHVKDYVTDYQARSNAPGRKKIDTIADMKRFVEDYPEFRKLGGNVSKHVALVGELSRLVANTRLLEVSELEQSLAANESHSSDLRTLQELLESADVRSENKLRLAMLYALRYQKFSGNAISLVVNSLPANGVPEADAALIHVMLNFAGYDQRQDDLFANENFFSRGKSALKGLKGVDNVYTQHSPHLATTLDAALRGRLKETGYPFLDGQNLPSQANAQYRPQDVIVFMIGGTTYEEARTVALMNNPSLLQPAGQRPNPAQNSSNPRIVLGGTGIINSKIFLDILRDAASRFPQSMTSSALSLRPLSSAQPASSSNLQLGNYQLELPSNLQLPVGGVNREQIEANVRGAAGAAFDLFTKVRQGVDAVL